MEVQQRDVIEQLTSQNESLALSFKVNFRHRGKGKGMYEGWIFMIHFHLYNKLLALGWGDRVGKARD